MSLNTSNIIHIVVEVITLLSITIYFMQQNKRMMDMIDSLSEQVEEHEEKIKKHDSVIADILKTLKERDAPAVSSPPPPRIITPITSMLNSVLLQQPSLDKFPSFFTQTQSHPTSSSFVEEADDEQIIEEEEEEEEEFIPPPLPPTIVPEPPQIEPQIVEISEESVKKKKKKKKKSSSASIDIDKELEDELNELYKEELLKNNT